MKNTFFRNLEQRSYQKTQSISQQKTKKQRKYNITFMHNLNVPKINFKCIVVTKALITWLWYSKRNVTMTRKNET